MGNVCNSQHKREHLNDIRFGQQNLVFRIIVSGIKAKNLLHNSSYVQIKLNEHVFKTTLIRYTKNPHWDNTFAFDCNVYAHQMSSSQFTVQMIDDSEKVHYKLKYSLAELTTDPPHHDIQFSNKASIIFDVKVAQRVQFKIMSKQIKCTLIEQLAEVAYSFKLKIKSQEYEKHSALSQTYANPTFEMDDCHPYKYGGRGSVSSMKHVSTKKALEAKKELQWEFRIEESPQLEFDIYVDDFSTTTFIFLLYAKKCTKMEEYKRIGSTYVGFNKFCYDNTSTIAQTDNIIITETTLQEQLFTDGQNIGVWKGQFIIKSNQFVQQQNGVRTQTGILNQSALLLKKAKIVSSDNKEIDYLIELQVKLELLSQAIREKKIKDSESIKNEILLALQVSNSSKLKLYQGEEEMLHCQQILIKLWKYLIENSAQQTEQVKELFYTVLSELIYREDMDLDYLSIDKREERLHVAQLYLQLMIKNIPISLNKVTDSSCSQNEHQFYVKFAVLAYFRIPHFRMALFPTIVPEKDHIFFSWVFNNEKGQILEKEFKSLKIDSQQEDFAFFLYPFVIEWCEFVTKKWGPLIDWEQIVGYEQIVDALLNQMQPKNQLFIKASCKLITNPMLLSRFLHFTYSRTKLYDAMQVFNAFNLINVWLQFTNEQFQRLPTNFDYHFFFKGVFLVLQGDHSVSISKCLEVIYNNFPLIPCDPKRDLCDFLFGDIFFKLILHWSQGVRYCFMHLLIFRIQHRHKSLKSGYEKIRDINQELQYAFQKVYPQKEKEQLINDMIYLKYSQLIQLIRKINQKFLNYDKYRNKMEKLFQEKSMRFKLFRKKQKENAPLKSNVPELTFESQLSQARSARGFQDMPNNSLKSLDVQEIEPEQPDPQDYVEYKSFSSFIDLNDILKEVEEEQDHNKKKPPITKMKSCEQEEKIAPSTPVKIHTRKMLDFELNLSQLEPSLLKYLPVSYQEWLKLQKLYQRWVYQMKIHVTDQNVQDLILDHPVPELQLIIPQDKSNQEAEASEYN